MFKVGDALCSALSFLTPLFGATLYTHLYDI